MLKAKGKRCAECGDRIYNTNGTNGTKIWKGVEICYSCYRTHIRENMTRKPQSLI